MSPINDPGRWAQLLTLSAGQLPILLVCLVGCIMMVGCWNNGSRAAGWALAGFGLSLALCVFMPLSQIQVQKWMAECGMEVLDRARAFTVLGLIWSILRAVSYGCLLMALLAACQRSEAGSRTPDPSNP